MSRIPVTSTPSLLPKLHLQHSAFFDLGRDIYIFEALRTTAGIAVSASNNSIKLYDSQTLAPTGTNTYHSDKVTQIKARPNMLLSSSFDQQVAIWDLRQSFERPAMSFHANSPVLSFDMSVDDKMLVGGTKLDDDLQATICFWDTHAGKLAKVFEESHSDDVTNIQCHPGNAKQLLSGSSDGLVCTYDVSQFDEDEALQFVANIGASVSQCGFFGPEAQFIYAQSDMETLQLWTSDATMLADFGDVRDVTQAGVPIDYVIGCRYDPAQQRLYLLGGSNSGDVHVMHVGAGSFEHVQVLSGGHSDIVRGFDWDASGGWAVSGGEDGRLSLWSTERPSTPAVMPVRSAEGSKKPAGGRRFNPY
ncbi:hypothetical protein FBU59_002115 [Linderina macrospora]|uniref:Uncharacterized protein n=1 Tax=Linderina macrospora TaxID=4868 RepID=A0ACC1JCD4_9FUNG|nr:hypothetical protein FBU59_002115 [Linderina macrospora]